MKHQKIWLHGAGRSDADLARLVEECNGNQVPGIRNRRVHERLPLNDAHGQLIYRGKKISCQVLEISAGGCSLKTDCAFCYGALTAVEIVLPILGMVLHIGGETQWTKKEYQLGIRFVHVNTNSKHQLEALISCLAGKRTVESILESLVSKKLNQNTGDVLIIEPIVPKPNASSEHSIRPLYDNAVHCGEGLVRSPKRGEWPAVYRSTDGHFQRSGDIADLSAGGCTFQTDTPFPGELKDTLELVFKLSCVHFVIGGEVTAIYDPETVGVRFTSLTTRRREELVEVIDELCAANGTRRQVA